MLNMAVCDDDPVFLAQMGALLDRDGRVGPVSLYSAPEDFLRAVDAGAGGELDAVLMDISFEERPSGLQCATALYRSAPQVAVVYVTGYTDYAQHILLEEANVAGYLTKPVDAALLGRYLDKLMRVRSARRELTISVHGRAVTVPAMSIRYIESRNHTAHVHTVSGETLTVYEKLSALQAGLPEQFIQCHKSFLVNMEQVERMEPRALLLRGGGSVPVSRARAQAAREAFFRCIGGKVL